MDHERIEELISEEIAGVISAADARALEEHLAACASCRALEEECRRQDRELREAFAPRRDAARRLSTRMGAALDATSRRTSRRAYAWTWAAGLAIGATIGGVAGRWTTVGPEGGPALPVARLAWATGPVEVSRGDDEWRALAIGASVPPETDLRTTTTSLAEVLLDDGTVLRLDRGSEVRHLARREWRIARGRVRLEVERDRSPLVVHVDEVEVESLATRFEVTRAGGGGRLSVSHGAAVVTSAAGSRVVRQSEDVDLESVELPGKRRAPLPERAWDIELLRVPGRRDAGVRARVEELLVGFGRSKADVLIELEIAALGANAVPALLAHLRSPLSNEEPSRRVRVAQIAGDAATSAEIRDLVSLLADGDGAVRVAAARALERLSGSDRGIPADAWAGEWSACERAFREWAEWARSR